MHPQTMDTTAIAELISSKTKIGWKWKLPSRSLQSASWQCFAPVARCTQTSWCYFCEQANIEQVKNRQNCFSNFKFGRLLKSIVFTRIPEAEQQFLETKRPVSKMFKLFSNNVQKPSVCILSCSWLQQANNVLLFTHKMQLFIILCSTLPRKPEFSRRK